MSEYLPDRIFAPAEAVRQLADTGTTPFFLYDQKGLEESFGSLRERFSWAPGHQNYFPLRENINPHILKILQRCGSGILVCSLAELKLAQACGFSGSDVLYEPTRSDSEAEALALSMDATWMIDSAALFPACLPNRLLLRYYPAEFMTDKLKTNDLGVDKCGFTEDQLIEQVMKLRENPSIRIGLALQAATYTEKSGFWNKKMSVLLRIASGIAEKTGTKIWAVHIGEGPGLTYRPSGSHPDLNREMDELCRNYQRIPEPCRPVLLTGLTKRLVDPHGILVTKVLEQRNLFHTFLIVDAGFGHLLRSCLRRAYRHVSVLGRSETMGRKTYTIVGALPDRFDRLIHKVRTLPVVSPGDYCVVHDVGCGARSMPVLFGLQPVAGEYLYTADGTIQCIAKGRSAEEVAAFLTAL